MLHRAGASGRTKPVGRWLEIGERGSGCTSISEGKRAQVLALLSSMLTSVVPAGFLGGRGSSLRGSSLRGSSSRLPCVPPGAVLFPVAAPSIMPSNSACFVAMRSAACRSLARFCA